MVTLSMMTPIYLTPVNNRLKFRLFPSKIASKRVIKIYTLMLSDDKSVIHVLSTFMVESYSKLKQVVLIIIPYLTIKKQNPTVGKLKNVI